MTRVESPWKDLDELTARAGAISDAIDDGTATWAQLVELSVLVQRLIDMSAMEGWGLLKVLQVRRYVDDSARTPIGLHENCLFNLDGPSRRVTLSGPRHGEIADGVVREVATSVGDAHLCLVVFTGGSGPGATCVRELWFVTFGPPEEVSE